MRIPVQERLTVHEEHDMLAPVQPVEVDSAAEVLLGRRIVPYVVAIRLRDVETQLICAALDTLKELPGISALPEK